MTGKARMMSKNRTRNWKKYDMDRIKIQVRRLLNTFQITYVDIGENPPSVVESSENTGEGVLIIKEKKKLRKRIGN